MVAVYRVLSARLADGVKVKILLVTSWVTVPATPGATVKVAVVMVVGSIAWGKVAAITVFGQTPPTPFGGLTETGEAGGRQATAAVLKVHTKLVGSELPNMSSAPVVIVAV